MSENRETGASFFEMFHRVRDQMEELQAKMCRIVVEGSAGGGMVVVRANCCNEIVSVVIDPSVADPNDLEMLQDLVVAATNKALEKARQRQQEEYARSLTGALGGLPGLFGPNTGT